MTSKKERRERMFNLQAWRVDTAEGSYDMAMCPLCLRWFGRDHLHGNCGREGCEDRLSIEDAPPVYYKKRLGLEGTMRRALTCEACNKAAGHSFETSHPRLLDDIPQIRHEVAAALKQAAANNRKKEMVPLTLNLTDVVGKHRIPEGLDDGRTAELKSAYIIAFASLGYSYILSPVLDQVREWLRSGDTPREYVTCSSLSADTGLHDQSVYVVRGDLDAVVVTQRSFHAPESQGIHMVWLPRPGGLPGTAFYKHLNRMGRHVTLSVLEQHSWPQSGWPDFQWDSYPASHHP